MKNIFVIQIKNDNTVKGLFTKFDLNEDYKITEHDNIFKAINAYERELDKDTEIVIVSDGFPESEKDSIISALNKYGVDAKPIYLDYREAFINYNIVFTRLTSYKNVALLFQREDNMVLYHADFDKKDRLYVKVNDRIYENVGYEELTLEEKDDRLLEILPLILDENIEILYLTTNAFSGGYMRKSLELLCKERRVFLEENLLILGGYAYIKNYYSSNVDIVINSKYTSPIRVSFDVKTKNGLDRQDIINFETRMYNEIEPVEIITYDESFIRFYITGNIEKVVEICIAHLVRGINKPTRLRIAPIFSEDLDMLSIAVQDIGFGAFVKPTYMQVKKIISLKDRRCYE